MHSLQEKTIETEEWRIASHLGQDCVTEELQI
jgi:hypothetical protein